AEDGIRAGHVTGVQTCALPIWVRRHRLEASFPACDILSAQTGRRVRAARLSDVTFPSSLRFRFPCHKSGASKTITAAPIEIKSRSEERRVGKECRWWSEKRT